MNRLAKWMMRLYPAGWRRRYGDEMDALCVVDISEHSLQHGPCMQSVIGNIMNVERIRLQAARFHRLPGEVAACVFCGGCIVDQRGRASRTYVIELDHCIRNESRFRSTTSVHSPFGARNFAP